MKEESNCFGLIIWIQAARGYTHLLRALSGWREAGMEERRRRGETWRGGSGRKERLASIRLSAARTAKKNNTRLSFGNKFNKMLSRSEEKEED